MSERLFGFGMFNSYLCSRIRDVEPCITVGYEYLTMTLERDNRLVKINVCPKTSESNTTRSKEKSWLICLQEIKTSKSTIDKSVFWLVKMVSGAFGGETCLMGVECLLRRQYCVRTEQH